MSDKVVICMALTVQNTFLRFIHLQMNMWQVDIMIWQYGVSSNVTWLKYCRDGVNLNPINQSINQSINQTGMLRCVLLCFFIPSLYISNRTIIAYCTDVRVISLFYDYTVECVTDWAMHAGLCSYTYRITNK